MNDYKEMREGKILLNRFPYNECMDFRRQSQHEKENLYFLTNDDGFFVKMHEAVGESKIDELEITRYYPESKNKEVRRIVSQKDSDGFEENLAFSTLAECFEHADAMYWNSREKIHRFPAENERLEGVYDTYDEAYKVLEEASRSGTPNLTVEIRREIQPDNEDRWCGLIEPPLDVMTTDNHGNISEIETLHFPEQKEIEVVKEKRWRLNESISPRRRGR